MPALSSLFYRSDRRTWRDAAPPTLVPMLPTRSNDDPIELEDIPRDCVQCHPSVGMGFTTMVGHDSDGIVQVELRLPTAWVTPGLERFILRMIRHYGKWRLRRLK